MNFQAIVPSHGITVDLVAVFVEATKVEGWSGSFVSEGVAIRLDFGEQHMRVEATGVEGRWVAALGSNSRASYNHSDTIVHSSAKGTYSQRLMVPKGNSELQNSKSGRSLERWPQFLSVLLLASLLITYIASWRQSWGRQQAWRIQQAERS